MALNIQPLGVQSVSARLQAGPSFGVHSFDVFEVVNAIQADLNNIATYLANHQHAALNAAPSTSVPAVAGAAWLAGAPNTPTAAAAVLFTQP